MIILIPSSVIRVVTDEAGTASFTHLKNSCRVVNSSLSTIAHATGTPVNIIVKKPYKGQLNEI